MSLEAERAQLLRWIEAETPDLIDLLARFARAASPNPPGDTREATGVLAARLEQAGIAPLTVAPLAHAPNLIAANLIDEFRIGICPVILGGGTPLFKPGATRKLKLIEAKALSTGVVINRYLPRS